MFEKSSILERTEALASASVETVEWAQFRTCDFFSNLSFVRRDTPFTKKQGLLFQESSTPKKSCMSLSFSKSTHTNTSLLEEKVCCSGCLHSYTSFLLGHRRDSAGYWTGPLSWSSLLRAAQGKLEAQPAQPLDISTKVATWTTILEAVDQQLGLQRPQNTRPLVCVLSTTLPLSGNKPWCNPLEMTKERKAQMWLKDSSRGMLASEGAQQQAGLAGSCFFSQFQWVVWTRC